MNITKNNISIVIFSKNMDKIKVDFSSNLIKKRHVHLGFLDSEGHSLSCNLDDRILIQTSISVRIKRSRKDQRNLFLLALNLLPLCVHLMIYKQMN